MDEPQDITTACRVTEKNIYTFGSHSIYNFSTNTSPHNDAVFLRKKKKKKFIVGDVKSVLRAEHNISFVCPQMRFFFQKNICQSVRLIWLLFFFRFSILLLFGFRFAGVFLSAVVAHLFRSLSQIRLITFLFIINAFHKLEMVVRFHSVRLNNWRSRSRVEDKKLFENHF